jgi:acyl-CoA dehydrogenase
VTAFALTPDQETIRATVLAQCARFDDDYWLAHDRDGIFPVDFHAAMAAGGWLGIAMPEEHGGAGLGITEAALMLQAVAESGAALSGASAIHMNIFGLQPVVVFGNAAQQRRMLPPLIAGRERACFAVTEPDVGLNTTALKTTAVRNGDTYVVHGRKAWISHDPARGGHAQDRWAHALLHRSRPLDDRGARDPEDGPQSRRFEPVVHRRPGDPRARPHR